jgi:hypothetical protein
MVTAGVEKKLGGVTADENGAVAPNLDLKEATLSSIDGLFLKRRSRPAVPCFPKVIPESTA